MAAFIPPRDRVLENSTSNSQTIFTVTGAVDTSYNAFSAHMAVNDWTIGAVVEPGVAFKSGKLTYSAANQVTIDSTGFESKGTFSSGGTKEVFMGLPAKSALLVDGSQALESSLQSQGRSNLYAAPFDAMQANNLFFNAGFEVAQEFGTGNIQSLVATGSLQSKYILDGVGIYYRGTFTASARSIDNVTAGLTSVVGAPPSFLQVFVGTTQSSLGANDELTIVLPILGSDMSRLKMGAADAQAQSLGFLYYGPAGTFGGSIKNGAKNRSYPFSWTIASASTLTWVQLPSIPGDTTGTWANGNTVGEYISICLAGGHRDSGQPILGPGLTTPAQPVRPTL